MVVVLTADQIRTFAATGSLVVPGIVAPDILDVLDNEVDRLIAETPPPDGHVGHHFYWRAPDESPALFDPLHSDQGILALADDLVGAGGVDVAFDQAQVALNIPSYSHRPGRPHIDGYAPGQHTPGTFTLLAGLLLTDQLADNGGNLWVWPGTHLSHATFFAARGPKRSLRPAATPTSNCPSPPRFMAGAVTCSSLTTCSATTSAATTRRIAPGGPSTGVFAPPSTSQDGRNASPIRGSNTKASDVCSNTAASPLVAPRHGLAARTFALPDAQSVEDLISLLTSAGER